MKDSQLKKTAMLAYKRPRKNISQDRPSALEAPQIFQ